MQTEIWKDILGFEGLSKNYQVSNLGNVRKIFKNGNVKVKKKFILNNGYEVAHLQINGKIGTRLVHRLVALAFIPNPENKPQVNHKNGIKTDNKADNLEWNTAKENTNHSFANKLQIPLLGSQNGTSKLTETQVLDIRKDKRKNIELAEYYNVSDSLICMIKKRKIWTHI